MGYPNQILVLFTMVRIYFLVRIVTRCDGGMVDDNGIQFPSANMRRYRISVLRLQLNKSYSYWDLTLFSVLICESMVGGSRGSGDELGM